MLRTSVPTSTDRSSIRFNSHAQEHCSLHQCLSVLKAGTTAPILLVEALNDPWLCCELVYWTIAWIHNILLLCMPFITVELKGTCIVDENRATAKSCVADSLQPVELVLGRLRFPSGLTPVPPQGSTNIYTKIYAQQRKPPCLISDWDLLSSRHL